MFGKSVKNFKNSFFATSNNPIIHNKIILYIIFFISLADLFILLSENDIFSITIFILIGFLTTYFSKNMLIVLFISLVITNLFKYGSTITNEGFEEEEEEKEKDKKEGFEEEEEEEGFEEEEEEKKSKKKSKKKEKEEDNTMDTMKKISKIVNTLKDIN